MHNVFERRKFIKTSFAIQSPYRLCRPYLFPIPNQKRYCRRSCSTKKKTISKLPRLINSRTRRNNFFFRVLYDRKDGEKNFKILFISVTFSIAEGGGRGRRRIFFFLNRKWKKNTILKRMSFHFLDFKYPMYNYLLIINFIFVSKKNETICLLVM